MSRLVFRWLRVCLVVSVVFGCDSAAKPTAPHIAAHDAAAPATPVAPLTATTHHGLPWYSDNLEGVLALARQQHKLVLVDLWAPWCHTCLSMREYVLTSDNLASVQAELLLLSLDTERVANAAALQRLPVAAWPTFYLVDGEGRVHGRWVGAASAAQLMRFVRDGLRTFSGAAGDDPALALLVEGDRLMAEGKQHEAESSYRRALSTAPADWARRPDALVSLAFTLRKLGDVSACVELGLGALSQTGETASATDFSYSALDCAADLPAGDRRQLRLRKQVKAQLTTLCFSEGNALTPDDRGDACGLLRELSDTLHDKGGAKKAAQRRLSVLEAAAQRVPDSVALTYDFARAETLVYLGQPGAALAMLQERERALPGDYNPPHYLARLYRDLGRHQEALAALERALSKAYGPRHAGFLGLKVDLLFSLGKSEEAKRTLEQQLAEYQQLPEGLKQPSREAAVRERLAELR